ARARAQIDFLSVFPFGQFVHLARVLALNARGEDRASALASDAHLARLAREAEAVDGGRELFRELGCDLPPAAVECLERLTARREALLQARRQRLQARAALSAAGARRRLLSTEEDTRLEEERERIECQLLLLLAAYVRRL